VVVGRSTSASLTASFDADRRPLLVAESTWHANPKLLDWLANPTFAGIEPTARRRSGAWRKSSNVLAWLAKSSLRGGWGLSVVLDGLRAAAVKARASGSPTTTFD
jgi:hypothetical protein